MLDASAPRWLQRARESHPALGMEHPSLASSSTNSHWTRPLAAGDEGLGEEEPWQADDIEGQNLPIMEARPPRALGDDRYPQDEQEAYDALAAAEVLASFGTIAGSQDEQAAQVKRKQLKDGTGAHGDKSDGLLGMHTTR